jgi:hypothetical protein
MEVSTVASLALLTLLINGFLFWSLKRAGSMMGGMGRDGGLGGMFGGMGQRLMVHSKTWLDVRKPI